MSAVETIPDLSLEYGLEQLNDFMVDDHLECEMNHRDGQPMCTHTVTHRGRQCNTSVLLCAAGAEYINELIRHRVARLVCEGCFQHISDCWTIHPI